MAKRKKKKGSLIGSWAFLIGVILAFVLGFFPLEQSAWTSWVLVGAGVIVGLLNVSRDEALGFMAAGTVLVIVTSLSQDVFTQLGVWATSTMNGLMLVFVPATIIVALRAVFGLAKD